MFTCLTLSLTRPTGSSRSRLNITAKLPKSLSKYLTVKSYNKSARKPRVQLPSDTADKMPLFHAWNRLSDCIQADEIPSPRELFEERDALLR